MSNIIKILRLETDINNDGFNEIFLSPIQSDNNQDEENWLVYIGVSNGMFRLAGMHTNEGNVPNRGISFKKNQYKIGLIPEINKHGLLYLSSGRGGQALCQLHAIVIEGEGWKNVAIGQLVTVETHYEELAQRFPNPPVPAVQELAP